MARVAVIRSDESMFWKGITDLLQADRRLEVSLHTSLDELSASDDASAIDVSVVPWSQSEDGYPWLDRLGSPSCRAVIGVDDAANQALLWTQQINHKTLLELLRVLGDLRSVGSQEPHREAEVIDIAGRRTELKMSPADGESIRSLLSWVELVVRERLADWPNDAASGHIPGWTSGLTQVRDLIGAKGSESRDSICTARQRLQLQLEPKGLVNLGDEVPLTELEQRIIALALAPELDGRFHSVYGFMHNDMTRGYASTTLLASLLAGPAIDALAVQGAVFDDGPIAELQLLEAQADAYGCKGPESALRVPDDLIEFLNRGRISERTLAPALRLAMASAVPLPRTRVGAELLNALEHTQRSLPQLIQLIGPRSTADWAASILSAGGLQALLVDVSKQDERGFVSLSKLAAKIARVARLTNSIPILERANQDGGMVQDVAALVLQKLDTVIVDLKQPWAPPASVISRIIEPFAGATKATAGDWQAAAQSYEFTIDHADAIELAATRRDDDAQVMSICRHAATISADDGTVELARLRTIARSISAPKHPALVRRIRPAFTWDDIVLRSDRLSQLREVTSHVRHSARVLDDWGYAARLPYGQAVAALFAGPSGTGKTMAAQIIAADLGVEVFQVDLAKTVSKYIGETEKHLDCAFEDAERASAVLLCDEADALFGKRTEVKDAHDRYANVEVAYLLQRLEQFHGLVILTTNIKQNVDAAFVRRLRFSIDFPSPEVDERLEIWKRAFPDATPMAEDLDLEFLARRFKLTGGHIQQIALMAAFLAAEHGRVEMTHISSATRQALSKLGMVSAEKTAAEMTAPSTKVLSA